jgi:hypothetical protein
MSTRPKELGEPCLGKGLPPAFGCVGVSIIIQQVPSQRPRMVPERAAIYIGNPISCQYPVR